MKPALREARGWFALTHREQGAVIVVLGLLLLGLLGRMWHARRAVALDAATPAPAAHETDGRAEGSLPGAATPSSRLPPRGRAL